MTFEHILNSLEQSDRESLERIASEHPSVKAGWMRQDDYSRNMDAIKQEREGFKALETAMASWNQWAEDNWSPEHNSTRAEVAYRARIQELESKPEMTFDQIGQYLSEQGVARKQEVEDILKAKESEFVSGLKGSAYVAAKLAELGSQYSHEFKAPFKATEFMGKFNEFGTSDFDKAFDMYAAPLRKAKEDKAMEERLEEVKREALKQGREEAAKQFIQENTGQLTPTNDSSNDIPSFQRRIQGLQTPADEIPAGMSAAAYAARKYTEEKMTSA